MLLWGLLAAAAVTVLTSIVLSPSSPLGVHFWSTLSTTGLSAIVYFTLARLMPTGWAFALTACAFAFVLYRLSGLPGGWVSGAIATASQGSGMQERCLGALPVTVVDCLHSRAEQGPASTCACRGGKEYERFGGRNGVLVVTATSLAFWRRRGGQWEVPLRVTLTEVRSLLLVRVGLSLLSLARQGVTNADNLPLPIGLTHRLQLAFRDDSFLYLRSKGKYDAQLFAETVCRVARG